MERDEKLKKVNDFFIKNFNISISIIETEKNKFNYTLTALSIIPEIEYLYKKEVKCELNLPEMLEVLKKDIFFNEEEKMYLKVNV